MNRLDSGDEFNEPTPNGVIIWSSEPLPFELPRLPKSARRTPHLAPAIATLQLMSCDIHCEKINCWNLLPKI